MYSLLLEDVDYFLDLLGIEPWGVTVEDIQNLVEKYEVQAGILSGLFEDDGLDWECSEEEARDLFERLEEVGFFCFQSFRQGIDGQCVNIGYFPVDRLTDMPVRRGNMDEGRRVWEHFARNRGGCLRD